MVWYRATVAILLAVFFASTLVLSIGANGLFNSPDENANWQFANLFSQTGELSFSQTEDDQIDSIIHPRSVLSFEHRLVPSSFLGLPVLSGLFGSLWGSSAILLFTPLLALLALLAWRSTMVRLFEDSLLADLSAFFLAIHPAFWYYSGRVMMHNVSFVAFLIFSAWVVVRRPLSIRQRVDFNFLFSGAMLGLAVATRSSELLWLAGLVITLFFLYRKHLSVYQVGGWLFGAVLILLPFAYLNQELYGGYLTTGYTVPEITSISSSESAPGSAMSTVLVRIYHFFFPFGIHELATLRHVWQYGFYLYPWLSFLSAVGLLIAIISKGLWRRLAVATIVIGAYLGVLYGSWNIADNPDPLAVTIGNSYARYWLPLFVIGSAFCALAVRFAVRRFGQNNWYTLTVFATLMVTLLFSVQVVWGGEDGFLATRKHLDEFAIKREAILSSTEDDAVIINDRADKYLWPTRDVVVPLRASKTTDHLAALAASAPLYYFGITLPETDLEFFKTTILQPVGLEIRLVTTVADESLYQIYD